MLLKLTNYGSNRPTLINMDKVESIYQVYDKNEKRMSTKICFNGSSSFVNVEEDLQTIMRLEQEVVSGQFQETDWITPTIEERILDSFETTFNHPQRQRTYRPRQNYNNNNYNSVNSFIDNSY